MATIKSYTDLEQSKKLAEILPLESADMWWAWYSSPLSEGHYGDFPMFYKPVCNSDESVPCWSLAALLNVLPDTITSNDGIAFSLYVKKNTIEYSNYSLYLTYKSVKSKNPIDACYKLILRLHELKMLRL